ncbi:MAG: ABC transporter ATP-binding protein [Nakamurella sp.]
MVLSYGQDHALRGVSVRMGPGESISLTGPSGSGKSSLLYCLSGLIRPTTGGVFFAGEDIGGLSDEDRCSLRRECFGFVFQSAELIPELTLVENVALPLELRRGGGARKARARAVALLELLGIAELAGRRPTQVSGGQAQRTAIARAMINEPAVLFADEPTGALDHANGEAVFSLLMKLTQQAGTTLVLVTHDDRLADRTGRRIQLLDGQVMSPLVTAG